jgi:hypothetical protein
MERRALLGWIGAGAVLVGGSLARPQPAQAQRVRQVEADEMDAQAERLCRDLRDPHGEPEVRALLAATAMQGQIHAFREMMSHNATSADLGYAIHAITEQLDTTHNALARRTLSRDVEKRWTALHDAVVRMNEHFF